jgi:L-aminopeptidase/D-esterase-like protein
VHRAAPRATWVPGAGATVGKLFGIERAMKGGIGTASLRSGGVTVAALVAVNAIGDVIDPADGQVHRRCPHADASSLQLLRQPRAALLRG